MRYCRLLLVVFIFISSLAVVKAANDSFVSAHQSVSAHQPFVAFEQTQGAFPVVSSGITSEIYLDAAEPQGVKRAAEDLRSDIYKVTGKSPRVCCDGEWPVRYPIIIGTYGKGDVVTRLAKRGLLNEKALKGKWESYVVKTLEHPMKGVDKALVIAGSDMRGTIYGIYELSRQMGVSPWYWWADVPVAKHKEVFVEKCNVESGEPKVKYRGIFINDEFPCMTSWARDKFGGMNSKMYAHVFELLLRLKANCLWPAMWGSFKEYKPLIPILKDENGMYEGNCFNEDDPENPRLANEYGIIMGTSHHEPMMRSQQEWIRHKKNYGNADWNWQTNRKAISRFFSEGIENTKNYENLVTIGMRGDEDRPMTDAGSREANFRQMEEIIAAQRQMIAKATGKPASETPQVWTLYSEVLDYYDQGLKVPDDVIVMLCDDNFGHVRRLPYLGKEKHKGGYGMYYHVGYYGAPRASKWLTMSTISEMWEQLQATYQYGVDKLWMLNVGDIKPHEFAIDFFMDMAWNPDQFNAYNLRKYAERFSASQFGEQYAEDIADLLLLYGRYASRINAEILDDKTYNLQSGEFKAVRDEFLALEAKALRVETLLDKDQKDAYQELVLFPIQGMANLYDMYYSLAMNRKLFAEGNEEANRWADDVEKCFVRDSMLCRHYNQEIAAGKWNHMMDQVHIGYTEWHAPRHNVMPKVYRIQENDQQDKPLTTGFVFMEKGGVVSIEAQHVGECRNASDASWQIIPGLGRSLSGIALFPYTASVDNAWLKYLMNLNTQADSVDVYLTVAAVMPFLKGGHQVALSIDEGEEVVVNLNQNLNWEHKYDLMYPTAAARVIQKKVRLRLDKNKGKMHSLQLRPLQPGIVFEKIEVDCGGGYVPSRLGMPETSYRLEK